MKLTKNYCETTKPGDTGFADTKDDLAPMFFRVKKNGERLFFWRGRIDGKQTKRLIGHFGNDAAEGVFTVADAREEARKMTRDAKAGSKNIPSIVTAADRKVAKELSETTVRGAFDRYHKLKLCDNKTGGEIKGLMTKHIFPDFGDRELRSLTRRELDDWFDARKLAGAGPGLNRVLSALKTFLKWCVAKDLMEFNPAQPIEKKVKEKPRKRMLAGDELAAVQLAIADCDHYATPLALLLHACCRRSDIFELTWRSFRMDEDGQPELFIQETKGVDGGVPHIVPLSPQALSLIPERPKDAKLDDRMFPTICLEPGSPLNDKANDRAKFHSDDEAFTRFRFHDFRSACSTYLADQRGRNKYHFTDRAMDILLTHVPVGVTRKHYNHSEALEERREMLALWSNHLDATLKAFKAAKEAKGMKLAA